MSTSLTVESDLPQKGDIRDLLSVAMERGASAESIAQLAAVYKDLQRFEWEREERQNRMDFDNALNACQSAIDRIAPNQKRENGIQWLDYVGLDKVLRPVYSQQGFSISYSEETPSAPGRVRMKATLSRGGISREFQKELTTKPANASMSPIDAEAAAAMRCKRYLMLQMFNVAVGIDKTEKDLIPMGERAVNDWLAAIESAATIEELTKIWRDASKAANDAGDTGALNQFTAKAGKRKNALLRKADGR